MPLSLDFSPIIYTCYLSLSGLKRCDVMDETEDVKEAIRRMPVELQDERIFRLRRAMQVSVNNTYLPKEQWTKYEEVSFRSSYSFLSLTGMSHCDE